MNIPTIILKPFYGQWLSELLEFQKGTPSDVIIFKTLPGFGATHGEILLYIWRNSILLEPNIPVMLTKLKSRLPNGALEYPNLFIVYKKVSRAQVERYLKNSTFPKKIMCTPEAFISKVKPAILSMTDYDLYNDFFMLLDECDKITRDVDFRETITLPINDFFKFKSKAMVSATALIPSDPRFVEHNFSILKVEPQFDYAKTINLIDTNNILSVMKNIMKQYGDERLFIFLNGTDLIHSIIKLLNIEDESRVFCADKSVKKLRKMGYCNASSELDEYAKVNFLTSRFFSAVDIKLENEKPNVILITDVFRAQHSMLDPYTDTIQILGRFRNGISRAVHISNFNNRIKWMEKLEGIEFLEKQHKTFLKVAAVKQHLQESEHSIVALQQALDGMDISYYVDEQNKLNPYMVDNFLLNQKIKSFYAISHTLNQAYLSTNYFKTKTIKHRETISDAQILRLQQRLSNIMLWETVTNILKHHSDAKKEGKIIYYFEDNEHDLKVKYPQIVNAFEQLGYEKMAELKFDKSKILKALRVHSKNAELNSMELKSAVEHELNLGDELTADEAREVLRKVYKKLKMTRPVKADHILKLCDCIKSTNKKNQKVYRIKGFKQ
jgi:hypothetical protein